MKTAVLIMFSLIAIWLVLCTILGISNGLETGRLKHALARGNKVRYYKSTDGKPKEYTLIKEVEITAVDDKLFKYTDKYGLPGFDRFEFRKYDYDKVEVSKGEEVIFVCGKNC